MNTRYFKRENQPALAYNYSEASAEGSALPMVVFLPGYASDKEGTKALYLEAQCAARGQAYLRFDYSAHGQSEGDFKEGTISSWTQDALDIIEAHAKGPVILVGSSMGGWIALNAALALKERVCGLVGIAAAPDFTRWIEAQLNDDMKQSLLQKGYFEEPNDYSDQPYIFTKKLLDDGALNLRLEGPLALSMPVILLQGMEDADVPWQTAHRIRNAIIAHDAKAGERVEVILIEHGDHRLSRDEDLALLDGAVRKLSGL